MIFSSDHVLLFSILLFISIASTYKNKNKQNENSSKLQKLNYKPTSESTSPYEIILLDKNPLGHHKFTSSSFKKNLKFTEEVLTINRTPSSQDPELFNIYHKLRFNGTVAKAATDEIQRQLIKVNFSYKPVELPQNYKGWIIVGFSDVHYLEVSITWFKRMVDLGYDNVVFYCLDDLTLKNMTKNCEAGIFGNTHNCKNIRLVENSWTVGEDEVILKEEAPENMTMKEMFQYQVNDRLVWKIRMDTLLKLFSEGYAVMISDVDAIWSEYIDITNFPANFDIINSACNNLPHRCVDLWGFSICAGLSLYRPTKATINFFKTFEALCTRLDGKKCNDQRYLNYAYEFSKIQWFNVEETNQNMFYEDDSFVGYERVGVIEEFYKFHRMKDQLEGRLQTMVMNKTRVFRGGIGSSLRNCDNAWIMNPMSPPVGVLKVKMFEEFKNCTPRVFRNKVDT